MNKRQRLVQESFLNDEEKVIKRLKSVYNQAQKDIEGKAKALQDQINTLDALEGMTSDPDELAKLQSMKQAKVYQKQYQDALKKQVNSILDNMQVEEFKTVNEYLSKCYEEGWLGTMYDLQGQGIPLIMPMDQESMVRAVQLDSKISQGLYTRLGEDVSMLKKKITAQVSRGIATGMSWQQVAQGLAGYTNIGFNNAVRIARTEGHRIQVQSGMDACYKAKEKGADVVKCWDSTLDGATRPSHQKVDGEIRELDEKFSNGLMFPGDPSGGAAEVINCRCALLQRAKWALDEDELETLKKRAEYFGLDKTENFEDFKKKYLKAAKEVKTIEQINTNSSKMLADVYERHRIKNGLSSVPYDDLGDMASNVIQANYGKMSIESATAFNDTLSSLADEYDTPLQKIRMMTKDEALGNPSFAFVSHNYTVDSAELVINPLKCKDIHGLTDRIKELSKNGYCARIPDEVAEKYIATHEFAHTLLNIDQPLKNSTNWVGADYGKLKKARKEVESVYEKYLKEVKEITEKQKKYEFDALMSMDEVAWKKASEYAEELRSVKISNYSLESVDEFMAESFANEKIGTTSNKYGKEVLEILDKYFKR